MAIKNIWPNTPAHLNQKGSLQKKIEMNELLKAKCNRIGVNAKNKQIVNPNYQTEPYKRVKIAQTR